MAAATVREGERVLVTCVVPWTEDWRFDEGQFRAEVAAKLRVGQSNLYVFGTAGEGYAVSDAQFLEVSRVFVEEMRAGGAEPMVGVISLSTPTIVSRIEAARALGVRRFQISMPAWGALSDAEIETFFEEVLGSFRDAEFLHYNNARAKRQLTGAEYGRLARRHPNLVATKQSTDSMRQIASSMEQAPQLRHYFVDGGYAYGSLLGECGLLPSLAKCNYDRLASYVQAGVDADAQALLGFQHELQVLAGGLRQIVGDGPFIDGAFGKVLWKLHAPGFPVRLLPPYHCGPDDAAARFRTWIAQNMPAWSPPDPPLVPDPTR